MNRHRRKDRAACLAVGCTVADWATGKAWVIRGCVLYSPHSFAYLRENRLLPEIRFAMPVYRV